MPMAQVSSAPTSLVLALRDELERLDPQQPASSLKAERLAAVAWEWMDGEATCPEEMGLPPGQTVQGFYVVEGQG